MTMVTLENNGSTPPIDDPTMAKHENNGSTPSIDDPTMAKHENNGSTPSVDDLTMAKQENNESTPSIDLTMSDLNHIQTRRSPSFSSEFENNGSTPSVDDLTMAKEENNGSTPSIDLTMSDLNHIQTRRSPRFSSEFENSAATQTKNKKKKGASRVSFFVGNPISDDEARRRWPYRYQNKRQKMDRRSSIDPNDDDEDELVLDVKCHYAQAEIMKCVFDIGDCAYVQGEKGKKNFVGKIVEFFKTMDDEDYFRVQWFYRPSDTVIGEEGKSHDEKRLFTSDIMNDNPLDCLVSKVKIIQLPATTDLKAKSLSGFDFYYDMKYSLDYSTFCTIVDDDNSIKNKATSHKSNMALLDLYSGCGGMSTGLCLGAKLAHVNLVTKWALDQDRSACESLRLNHPEAQIRNEPAEDFLNLLREWNKLCNRYVKDNDGESETKSSPKIKRRPCSQSHSPKRNSSSNLRNEKKNSSPEFEVAKLVDICYGDPNETGRCRLHFQVRWEGYGSSDDTWEPLETLSHCQERVQDFVVKGHKIGMLPRPGDVDVICGGPPCQGISGYNRHRNVDNPLEDEKNRQIVVFMDIVEFLKPTHVLMENVGDILRLANGQLGKYAISRLVQLNYQSSLGIMAAGCYGLPQFRLRVFLWGAHPNERLPQFPLPTHDVVLRYGAPSKFQRNVVAYDEDQTRTLEKALVIEDAISDLPPVSNGEIREEMAYRKPPQTEFQKYIRASQCDMMGTMDNSAKKERRVLYDHRPLQLYEDDYTRVSKIPHRKGANFRDLPGVIIGKDNVVERDPESDERVPSGKLMVPDYAINFGHGKSSRPFARLWWDETVPTILTVPDHHSQAILHPEQDRVLTIRECARLQGFPDYYRFCGTVKERYCQVGNAVAVPVGRALGYALGMSVKNLTEEGPLMILPTKFSHTTTLDFLQASDPS